MSASIRTNPEAMQAAADALRGVVGEMDCLADAELVELRAQQWEAEAAALISSLAVSSSGEGGQR